MELNKGEHFPVEIEGEGTVVDYVDGEWVFVFKDEEWCEHEIHAVAHKSVAIDFVYKYDIAIFLLTVEDAIDTSDFIFCVHDNEYPQTMFEPSEEGDFVTIYLVNGSNVIVEKRHFQLTKAFTNVVKEKLKQQKETTFYEEEFTCNLDGLQSALEPFELQELAIVSESH